MASRRPNQAQDVPLINTRYARIAPNAAMPFIVGHVKQYCTRTSTPYPIETDAVGRLEDFEPIRNRHGLPEFWNIVTMNRASDAVIERSDPVSSPQTTGHSPTISAANVSYQSNRSSTGAAVRTASNSTVTAVSKATTQQRPAPVYLPPRTAISYDHRPRAEPAKPDQVYSRWPTYASEYDPDDSATSVSARPRNLPPLSLTPLRPTADAHVNHAMAQASNVRAEQPK